MQDYPCFKKYCNIIAIDLSKQQVLHADLKAIKQINSTENLQREPNSNTAMLFIIQEAKETILNFSQGAMRVLRMCFTSLF